MRLIRLTVMLAAASIFFSACSSSKYMRQFHRKAKKEVGAATIRLKKDTVRVVYPELAMFDFGKDELKTDVKPSLQRFAGVLKDFDRVDFIINGYTDNVGTGEVNESLSHRRADNAKTFMQENGVAGNRMQTDGKGPNNPIATNETEEGRKQNRRVEFLLFERK